MALLPDGNENVVVEARNLTKRYGRNEALKGVSFSIGEKEIVGFIGPNGAGKSTTMNILSGYLAPTGGQVRICGIDLLADPARARRQISYLPEIPPLYMDMTVEEQICFASSLSGVKKRGRELRAYALQLMEKTHVTGMRHRLIKNLSKGYRQRVAVAQLLAGDPKILILDEPTVGLDPRQIREFRDLFLELGLSHTIIFSSHILSEINSICSRIFIFDRGELKAQGKPDELQRQLSGLDTLRLRLTGNWEEARERIGRIGGVKQVREISADPGPLWKMSDDGNPGNRSDRVGAGENADAGSVGVEESFLASPAGAMPAGAMPAEIMPAGAMPAETMPAGAMSADAMPAGAARSAYACGETKEFLISFTPGTDIMAELNRQIRLAGCGILLLQPEQLSLEDLYLRVTDQDTGSRVRE